MRPFPPLHSSARADDGRSYFVAYELIKKELTPKGQDPAALSLGAVVVAGGLAGVTMWTFAIPPDVRPPSSFRARPPANPSPPHAGHQVPSSGRPRRHLQGLRRLRRQDCQGGRGFGPLQGVRTGHGARVPGQRGLLRTSPHSLCFVFREGWRADGVVQLGVELSLQAMNKVF